MICIGIKATSRLQTQCHMKLLVHTNAKLGRRILIPTECAQGCFSFVAFSGSAGAPPRTRGVRMFRLNSSPHTDGPPPPLHHRHRGVIQLNAHNPTHTKSLRSLDKMEPPPTTSPHNSRQARLPRSHSVRQYVFLLTSQPRSRQNHC